MYVLMAIVITAIIYVVNFKEEFTQEHIDKVLPFMIIVSFIVVVLVVAQIIVR